MQQRALRAGPSRAGSMCVHGGLRFFDVPYAGGAPRPRPPRRCSTPCTYVPSSSSLVPASASPWLSKSAKLKPQDREPRGSPATDCRAPATVRRRGGGTPLQGAHPITTATRKVKRGGGSHMEPTQRARATVPRSGRSACAHGESVGRGEKGCEPPLLRSPPSCTAR